MYKPLNNKPTNQGLANDHLVRSLTKAHATVEENRIAALERFDAVATAIDEVRSEIATLESATKSGFDGADDSLTQLRDQLSAMAGQLDHMRHWVYDCFDRTDARMETDRQLTRVREMALKQEHVALVDDVRELGSVFDGLVASLNKTPRYVPLLWAGIVGAMVFSLILKVV